MIAYLEKALNVRRQELLPASLLFLYLFIVIGAYIMGQSAGDALFLNAFPNGLAYAIIATSVAVGIFVSVYIRLSHRVQLERLNVGLLLFFAGSFAVLWWLTHSHNRWVYPAIFIFVYAAGAMAPMVGWTLGNYVLTTREARRVFGFIGAGAILGATFSGLLTAAVTHAIGVENLLLVMAAALAGAAIVVKALFVHAGGRITEAQLLPSETPVPRGFQESWKLIRSSRYLLLITALIAIGSASTTIIGYQFKMIAKEYFANKEALAAFFGQFYGYMGLASFFLQIILTGRLLRSFGIRITLFVLPVVFIGGSLAVLLAPILATAVILKGSHNLLRYSIDKSSAELLYLPVASDIKNQVKSFIDGFVWRTADGFAGVVLVWFATVLNFSPGRISLVNFAFLAGWIAIAYGVRREYLNVLCRAIQRNSADSERQQKALDSNASEMLAIALDRGDEQQALYGLSLYEQAREPRWHTLLRGLLQHPSPAVRERVLRLLNEAGDRSILGQVQSMLRDRSPAVRSEAMHYLVVHTQCDPISLLGSGTEVPDYALQGAVVAYLARMGKPQNNAGAEMILENMLSRDDGDGPRARVEAARVLGIVPPSSKLVTELLRLLRDEDPEVVQQALVTAGKTLARDCLPVVIERLAQPRFVAEARATLVQYGERAVGTLQDHLNDENVAMAVRKQIPDTVARIGTRQAAAVLALSLMQSDPGLRFDVVKALNKLRRTNPQLITGGDDFETVLSAEITGFYRSFQILAAIDPGAATFPTPAPGNSVLVSALHERMEHEFERIFRMLALAYPPHDIHNAYVSLTSEHPHLQANALEVLEHMLKPELYRRLVCALDTEATLDRKLAFAAQECHSEVPSRAGALRLLLYGDDAWLRACALHVAAQWRMVELYEEILALPHEGDDMVNDAWNRAVSGLDAEASAQGVRKLSVLEKVDQLKKVPIFQDVRTESLGRLAAVTEEVTFRPNDVLYRENEAAEGLYVILEGEIAVSRDGQEMGRLRPNELAGVLGALAGEAQPETATAARFTRTLKLDQQDFYDAMADDFHITRGILRGLIEVINVERAQKQQPLKVA